MKSDKPLIRKTLSQERFEVLIKRQKSGEASFRDLIELDEIVNRVPDIRLTILEEMEGKDTPDGDTPEEPTPHQHIPQISFFEKVKLFFDRLLHFNTATLPLA